MHQDVRSTSTMENQQRSRCETATIARRMRELDRIRQAVESDAVRSGNGAGPSRRNVDRPIVSRGGHGVTQKQRRPRRGITLCDVVRLVDPRAIGRMRLYEPRRVGHHHLEQVDANRKIRRHDDAKIGVFGLLPKRGRQVGPPRRPDHGRQLPLDVAGKIVLQRRGRGKVDRDVGRGRPVAGADVDPRGNFHPLRERHLFDELAHLPVAN